MIDTFNAISAPVNTICIGGCYSAGASLMAASEAKAFGLVDKVLDQPHHKAE